MDINLEIGDSIKTNSGVEGRIIGIDTITNQVEIDTVLPWIKLSDIIRLNGVEITDDLKLIL